MSSIKKFLLPDLGEGLPDAEIVQWHVDIGEHVQLDAPLVSMETAKAVVDVPSPFSGKLIKIAGMPGDTINTGTWLAVFEIDSSAPQRADSQNFGHHQDVSNEAESISSTASSPDAGTVVGAMQSSDQLRSEAAITIGGIKAMPVVRALAKKLKVNLQNITPSGADGVVTLDDVRKAAEHSSQQFVQPAKTQDSSPITAKAPSRENQSTQIKAQSADAFDQDQPIRGVRRAMLRTMSDAHAQVVPTTLMDDADIHAWQPGEDITVRLIHSITVAAQTVPTLNAWLDPAQGTLRLHSRVDIGIAVDTDDGLFVAAIRDCEQKNSAQLRTAISTLREQVKQRSIPADALRNYTIMLSNFGVFAGKYATPVVVPPCVCIIGAGRVFHQVVPVLGGIETHRNLPISLTFDHRACTGGEAARFLRAMLNDLQQNTVTYHAS